MFNYFRNDKILIPSREDALPGRVEEMRVSNSHYVNGNPLQPPFSKNREMAMFGLGCFWGAEKRFWEMKGVFSTAVGYAGGYTPNPTYEEVCTGMTGHNEVVRVIYSIDKVRYGSLLKLFFESHDPTQGMRQGNDVGSQYRSGIYPYNEEQKQLALQYRSIYQQALKEQYPDRSITTEIEEAPIFYFAEDYHQQYLAKNPNGYCGLGGLGIECSIGG